MGQRQDKHETLDRLRHRIARIEGWTGQLDEAQPRPETSTPRTGALNTLEQIALPRLHEIAASAYGDLPPARAFALAALLARPRAPARPVLWCQTGHEGREFGHPHGPGLAQFGLAPDGLILVRTRTSRDTLWAMEEGLQARALEAVLGEVGAIGLTAARRLSLAARENDTPCLLLRPHGVPGSGAAWTRWRIAGAPGAPDTLDQTAPGAVRWQVTLERLREPGVLSSGPTSWIIGWSHETHHFHLVAPMADRPDAPGPAAPRGDTSLPVPRAHQPQGTQIARSA